MDNILLETKNIMQKYKIQANKSLGQNFLIDEIVVNSIIDSAKVSKKDLVIEIGPGLGVLTSRLLKKANKVIAVELDKNMINVLKDRFKEYNNFELINNDILKVDLKEVIRKEKSEEIEEVKIVANLPYYISTPIIMKLLEERLDINTITVMVQKEVGQRLTAKTGQRLAGSITYAVEYYSNSSKVIDVSKECFIPSPKVESEVVKLEIKRQEEEKVEDEELLFKIIKVAFSQRRKTFMNTLVNTGILTKQEVEEMLIQLGLDENIRGENLKLEDFIKITNYINKKRYLKKAYLML